MRELDIYKQLGAAAGEICALLQSGEDEAIDYETGEIMPIEERIAQLQGSFEEKAEVAIAFADEFDAITEAYDRRAKQLATVVRRRKDLVARIKKYIADQMHELGIKKISGNMYNVTLSGSDVVKITSEDDLPDQYIKTQVVKSPDKNAIKVALKNGENIPGAELSRSRHIIVR